MEPLTRDYAAVIRPGLALRDQIARALARIMEGFAFDRRYFNLWQRHGYHVRPVHVFSPLPDTSALPDRIWESASALPGVDLNESGQLRLLTTLRNKFSQEYGDWPARRQSTPPRFFFDNNMFESVDAELLYGLIRLARPRRFV